MNYLHLSLLIITQCISLISLHPIDSVLDRNRRSDDVTTVAPSSSKTNTPYETSSSITPEKLTKQIFSNLTSTPSHYNQSQSTTASSTVSSVSPTQLVSNTSSLTNNTVKDKNISATKPPSVETSMPSSPTTEPKTVAQPTSSPGNVSTESTLHSNKTELATNESMIISNSTVSGKSLNASKKESNNTAVTGQPLPTPNNNNTTSNEVHDNSTDHSTAASSPETASVPETDTQINPVSISTEKSGPKPTSTKGKPDTTIKVTQATTSQTLPVQKIPKLTSTKGKPDTTTNVTQPTTLQAVELQKSTTEAPVTSHMPTIPLENATPDPTDSGNTHDEDMSDEDGGEERTIDEEINSIEPFQKSPKLQTNNNNGIKIPIGPKPTSTSDGHFSILFMSSIVLVVGLYALYHNRQKIVAIVVEGNGSRRTRERPNTRDYDRLDRNVGEAMPTMRRGIRT